MMVYKIVNEFSSSLYIHVIYHSVVTLVIRLVTEMTFIFNGHKTGLPVNVVQLWASCRYPGTDFPLFMNGCTKMHKDFESQWDLLFFWVWGSKWHFFDGNIKYMKHMQTC